MAVYGIGQSVRRAEDLRFLTGSSQFVDDIDVGDMLHGVLLAMEESFVGEMFLPVRAKSHRTISIIFYRSYPGNRSVLKLHPKCRILARWSPDRRPQ